jgi:uncharacterized membrane protein
MRRRFWRILRLLAVFSVIVAAIAIVLVTQGTGEIHPSLIIATGVGVFFTVLLGTGLMTLQFLSSESGHDEAAADHSQRQDKK